jgi:lipoprotein-anchoring transpeptidase ErfK/SrfK
VVRKGLCSTGSFIQLEVDSTKSFMFETPKGVLSVQNKIVNPVWRKPDWAFIEEGLPVPAQNHPSRYEKGVLGDYALSLGDGYLIHGTLYQRFIGMPVTHGCVRLGDEDLEVIYKTMQVGSKVFIY